MSNYATLQLQDEEDQDLVREALGKAYLLDQRGAPVDDARRVIYVSAATRRKWLRRMGGDQRLLPESICSLRVLYL